MAIKHLTEVTRSIIVDNDHWAPSIPANGDRNHDKRTYERINVMNYKFYYDDRPHYYAGQFP